MSERCQFNKYTINFLPYENLGNEVCKYNNNYCSSIFVANNLCQKHYKLMAIPGIYKCKCNQELEFCNGDAIARRLYIDYFNKWDIAVIDMPGEFYCCGSCQNRNTNITNCGNILICKKCINKHPKLIQN